MDETGTWGIVDRLFGPVPDLPNPEGLGEDRRATVILWSVSVLLVLLIFRGGFPTPGSFNPEWSSVRSTDLGGRIYWALWGFVFYLAVPFAIIGLVFRESPARYGFRIYLTKRTILIYAGLVIIMLPALFWAGTQDVFLRKYPFVKNLTGDWEVIVLWETIYLARFIALEFFFRGYLLFGLEKKFGTANAIAISVIPYSIMHFAKPFPEAMGAIVAGAVLGIVALRTRSILGGAIIHCTIALSMDLLALYKKGVIG